VVVLKQLWEKWKILAHKIGDFQARLILMIFYFVLLAPFALVIKFFSDPLRLKAGEGWLAYPSSEENPALRARRQF
jgi:hypothetical protein